MKVSPITYNQYKSNNPAQNPMFNAINQKYYNWGKEEIENRSGLTINFLYCIESDVISFKDITPQDGVDTLKALRDLLKPKKDECLNETIGIFKQLAKQERIEQRRALKKLKKH